MAKKLELFLEIIGKDLASPIFNKIGASSDSLKGSIGGIGGSITGSILAANLFQTAATTAFSAVTSGIGAMGSALGEAANRQTSLLSATAAYSAIGNVGFDVAEKSLARINKQLDKSAAALPGAAAEYTKLANSITDNVLPAYQGLDGSIDFPGFEKEIVSLSESYGALGKTAGVATEDISKGLGKALSGKSIAELGDLQLFENNPALLSEIEKKLAEKNVSSLKDLDLSARVGLIREAGESFITDEYKTAAANSVDGLVESFKSSLFGDSGIFSATKDLFPDTEGIQSVFTVFNSGLNKLIGSGGIFAGDGPLNGLLKALGINLPDPMLVLYNASTRVIDGIDRTATYLKDLSTKFSGSFNIAKSFGAALGSFSGAKVGERIGMIYGAVVARFSPMIESLIDRFPAVKIGTEIGEFIGSGLINLIRYFPWDKAARVAFKATLAVGNLLASGLVSIAESAATALGEWLMQGLRGAFSAVNPKNLIKNAWAGIQNSNDRQYAISAGDGTSSAFRDRLRNPGRNNDKGRSTGVRASRSRIMNRALGQMPTGFMSLAPDEAHDILSAAVREKRAMPGADLVVANSTEAIIPRGGGVSAGPVGSGRSSGGGARVTMNNTFNLNMPQGSTREQAKQLLVMLDQLMQDSLEGQLA